MPPKSAVKQDAKSPAQVLANVRQLDKKNFCWYFQLSDKKALAKLVPPTLLLQEESRVKIICILVFPPSN
jgi:hypothetical protein